MVARSWPLPYLIGELGEGVELVAGDAAAEDAGAYGGEAGLLLRGDADVVAVDVVGDVFGGEMRLFGEMRVVRLRR